MVRSVEVGLDTDWELDYGCWSVLKQMFPGADIPVAQFSLDYTQQGMYHFNLAKELPDYLSLGDAVQLAVPTPEHYLPMLYALALKNEEDTITYFNDKPLAGSLTMTSLLIQ